MLVLFIQLSVVANSDRAHFEKVSLDLFSGWLSELKQNEGVRFNVGNQLFLLLQDIFEVLHILVWALLLLKFFDQSALTQLNQSFEVVQEHLLTHEDFDCLREYADGFDG